MPAGNEICAMSLCEMSEAIGGGQLSPVDAVEAVLARIAEVDPKLNAFTTVCAEEARQAARAMAEELARGVYRGPLHGIPVGVKDLYDTAGIRTTYGSGSFRDHVPTRDAGIVRRLRTAGAVVVGKTATHEWGVGITTNNAFFGPTRNPWNPDHVPGGSSGGSGAAVAADLVPLATGSDGGGSIRFPSVWNGVCGIKPTLGLVSNTGEFGELGGSFSVSGPIARTLADCALALEVLAGFDPEYPWSVDVEIPRYAEAIGQGVDGLLVGVSPEYLASPVHEDVRAAFEAALRHLETAGARIEEVRLPHHSAIIDVLFVVLGGECAAVLRKLERERGAIEYGPDTQPLVELALGYTIDDYTRAQATRELLRRDYRAAFERVDAILAPTAPIPAPRIGEDHVRLGGEEHFLPQLCCTFTAAANLTGIPSVAVPYGLSRERLPVGVQVMAPHFDEETALRVAGALLGGREPLRSPMSAA